MSAYWNVQSGSRSTIASASGLGIVGGGAEATCQGLLGLLRLALSPLSSTLPTPPLPALPSPPRVPCHTSARRVEHGQHADWAAGCVAYPRRRSRSPLESRLGAPCPWTGRDFEFTHRSVAPEERLVSRCRVMNGRFFARAVPACWLLLCGGARVCVFVCVRARACSLCCHRLRIGVQASSRQAGGAGLTRKCSERKT